MPADQRLKEALRLILKDPDEDGRPERWRGTTAAYPDDWENLGYVEYFYRRDTLLVRTEEVDLVLDALTREPEPDDQEAQATDEEKPPPREDVGPIIPEGVAIGLLPVIDGVTSLVWRNGMPHDAAGRASLRRVRGDQAGAGYGERPNDHDSLSTPNVLRRLDQVLGVGKATPDHALSLCGNGHPCPATEPAVVPSMSAGPVPPMTSGICCGTHGWDGHGVVVGVVDEGLIDGASRMWPWMAGVDGDTEDPYVTGKKLIKPYACHGTFVAGCVRCMAPKATVCVKRAEPIDWHVDAGMAYEDEIIRRMDEVLDLGADIIVCEFDGITRFHRPMLTFNAFYDKRLRHLNAVVVAPAGNDTTNLPTFPAAYSWVIGVGALSADGNSRADFSNYGGWVDVYALGEDLVNAFAVGDYVCFEDDEPHEVRRFAGIASWSGTSFSAPLMAGMIAARMSATGENAPIAAEALLRLARSQAVPGVGPVLLPHQVCGTPREPCHSRCDCECRPKHC